MVLTNGLARSAPVRRLAAFSIFALAALAVLIAFGTNRAVSNADWQVLAVSGEVEWRGPGTTIGGWQDVEANGHLPDGAEIRTGGNGNAVVAKGLDRIEIRPATELVVAARQSPKGALEIDQTSGSVTYTVEKRPAGTFSVHTPYVVAVVKGTKFDVDITNQETSVSVSEGRVGVSDRRSGDSIDVTPGQRATSSRKAAGVNVEAATKSSKAPGTPNPNANPNAQIKANANPNANVNSTTRGNSATAPGQSTGSNASAEGHDNSGGNSGDSDSGGGGGGSGGSDSGGGGGGGSGGSDSGGGGGGGSGGGGSGGGGGGGPGGGGSGGGGKDK